MSFFRYIKESVGEARHIKWPTRAETIRYTVAVLVISLIVAYYLGLLDIIFAKGVQYLITH